MNTIRVEVVSGFESDEVVLLAADTVGLDTFGAALTEAQRRVSAPLDRDGVTHRFVLQSGLADIGFAERCVTRRLDRAEAAAELSEGLAALRTSAHPCHRYVDIGSPTATLVLSGDEYSQPLGSAPARRSTLSRGQLDAITDRVDRGADPAALAGWLARITDRHDDAPLFQAAAEDFQRGDSDKWYAAADHVVD
ncbi:hypothetical protein [Mycobacterium sp. OAE908]|uniref:hypothetical protein n=1 Tax=Mycobacterium sp. OAE908 TaxID=2817899 RepID=UPI001AE9ACEE